MPSCAQRSASHYQGKSPVDGHNEMVAVGGNGLEERFRSGFHLAVHEDFAVLAHHTDLQTPGLQVDAAITLVLASVESPEVSSS